MVNDGDFTDLSRQQLDRIDAACDRFESDWSQDSPAGIEQALEEVSQELREPLFRELLGTELDHLHRRGLHASIETYRSRFLDLTDVISQVFDAERIRVRDGETRSDTICSTQVGTSSILPPTSEHQDLPREFGRYRLLRLLGRGGMGTVYLAHDKQLDRQIALKMPDFGNDPEVARIGFERFQREVRLMARVRHRNVCPIYDFGENARQPYLTMAFIEGTPLSKRLENQEPISTEESVRIVRTLAAGVGAIHQAGVIHRDLKPANVLVDGNQELFITDFGLASRGSLEAELTTPGTVLGSPAYMAPEQVRGEPEKIGPATDVYALGVILYQLLSGRRPFAGNTFATLGQIMAGIPPRPLSELVKVDADLESICQRAMAHEVKDRFPSTAELASALEPFFPEPVYGYMQTANTRKGLRPRNGRWAGLLLLLLIALPGVMAIYTIATPYGKVVVHAAEGADVEIEVQDQGNLVAVLGAENNWQVEVAAGEYHLKLRGADRELKLDQDRILVSRNRHTEVMIVTEAWPPALRPIEAGDGNFALALDGESTYAYIPALTRAESSAMTLEAWINPLAPHGSKVIARLGGKSLLQLGVADHALFAIDWMSGTPYAKSLQDYVPDAVQYESGKWYHVAVVSTEEEARFYVNGIRAWRMPRVPQVDEYPRVGLWIGAQPEGDQVEYFFRGHIDELRVSTVARYAREFQPPTRFETDDQTLALYHFDEGQGRRLIDATGKHHGNVYAASWAPTTDPGRSGTSPQ